MDCLSEDAVLDVVERRLDGDVRQRVEAHLDKCASCRQLVAATAAAILDTAPGGDAPASLATGWRPGETVGRYTIEARLGGGGMGVVFAARHLDLGRTVALKIARGETDADRARLVREARAASALRHPNIVTVHDVFPLDDGSPVIVMDLLDGESLATRLDRGPMPLDEAVDVVGGILDALVEAHGQGVVHRDLKPDNVFLTDAGVKILDFGIAKLTAAEGPAAATADLTTKGAILGTPRYMAPEQAFAEDVDARADLWAVGVILFECLTGEVPFDGDTMGAVIRKLATLDHEPLDALRPDTPRGVVTWVHALLVPRDERPDDAERLRARLLAAVREDAASVMPPKDETGAPRWGLVALGIAVVGTVGVWLAEPDAPHEPLDEASPRAEASAEPPVDPPPTSPASAEPVVSAASPAPRPSTPPVSVRPPPPTAPPPSAAPPAPKPGLIVDPPF